jgi:hypothetical protein
LSFFEPAVEKVDLELELESTKTLDNKVTASQKLNAPDVMNLNFTVALYETIFVLMDSLKVERIEH